MEFPISYELVFGDLKEGTIDIKIVGQGNKNRFGLPMYIYANNKFDVAKKILGVLKISFHFQCLHGCPQQKTCSCVLYINYWMTHCCKKCEI